MILWTSKVKFEKELVVMERGIRSWRWVLSLSKSSISLIKEVRSQLDPCWDEVSNIAIYLSKDFTIKQYHSYYDGPHCRYIFLGFNLETDMLWNCKKCLGED